VISTLPKKQETTAASFTPRINPISDNLDNRQRVLNNKSGQSTQSRRCDTLYELAMQNKQLGEQKRRDQLEERVRLEMQEATFRPWITSKASEQYGQGVVERNLAWQENRVKKIEQMKAMVGEQPRRDMEVEECTFRPKINNCR